MTKKNIRKFFVFLCAMLLSFALVACSGKADNDTEVKEKTENVKTDDKDKDADNKDSKEDAQNKENDDKDFAADDKDSTADDKNSTADDKDTAADDKDSAADDRDSVADDKENDEGDGKENQDGTITMKTSGQSANGKISFIVNEDEELIFSADTSYGLTEDAMMFIVPKGEYKLCKEARKVKVDDEDCEEELDENGRRIFEFYLYGIAPGEYDMLLATDYDGYICAKWSIAIESDDVYEIDLSKLEEYDKPEGFDEETEDKEYQELAEGEWPSDVLPKPEGCTFNGGGENVLGMIVYVKWNDKQDVLNYIEVLKGMGIEADIDLMDDEEINWYADEIRVIYTVSEDDDDVIIIR